MLRKISNELPSHPSLRELIRKANSAHSVISLSGLRGTSKSYIASEVSSLSRRPILFLSSTRKKALEASEDLSFFLGKTPPALTRKELTNGKALFSSVSRFSTDRINWLYSAQSEDLIVAEVGVLFEKFMPRGIFDSSIIEIKGGELLLRDDFIASLIENGYHQTDFVEKQGEVSVRGSIVDVLSPGQRDAVRFEFLGDEIGSIRLFNTEDQKSSRKISSVAILPASEVKLNAATIARAINFLKAKAGERQVSARDRRSLIEEIEKGNRIPNVEWLLPAFYDSLSSAFDYLRESTIIIYDEPEELSVSLDATALYLSDRWALLEKYLKVTPDQSELFFTPGEVHRELSGFKIIRLQELELSEDKDSTVHFRAEPASVRRGVGESPIDALLTKIAECKENGYDLHLVFRSQTERDKLVSLLLERGIHEISTHLGNLSEGFRLEEQKLEVLTEKEIIGEKRKRVINKKPSGGLSAFITSFSELKPGDYIVHVNFGIGIFRSLKRLKIGSAEGDFLQCEYAGGDIIYVPFDKLKLVQRYIGDGKKPRIDRLGSKAWGARVDRIRKVVEVVARELLELYAKRRAMKGFSFSPADELFSEFELAFPYEETPDQEAAITDVFADMESTRPMDRLICGDVGFGKTEVALRAAFKAVADGKQVAFLVPTTLLAHQHYETFLQRLKGYPVVIGALSRFTARKEEKEMLSKLQQGKIDIVIGTHKILSEKVKFRDLGLVINDEEHRFGVSQKEKLKKIKQGVDAVSLSATPIPRTLQLSLAKIRDISLINTPPQGRQTIETYLYRYDSTIIKQAIKREIDRGGAVFFIHNRIADIYRVAERISALVPEAKIAVTHGRLREKELEDAIAEFIEGDVDVLVTTAIVESGLDIPRANTIIINDAHTFGLADLYQLRGRVGRSREKAYAYFLIPSSGLITSDSRRRLRAISEFKDLGSGFKLALSDLEIRGAGHLFGNEQSGHVADVGLEFYLDMLDGSIKRLEGNVRPKAMEPEVSINMPAFIPDDYISSDTERLLFYKRLSTITGNAALQKIRGELDDRFGKIPVAVNNLLELIKLKLVMKELGVEKVEVRTKKAIIIISQNSKLYEKCLPSGKMEILFEQGEDSPLREIRSALRNLNKACAGLDSACTSPMDSTRLGIDWETKLEKGQ